VFIVLPPQVCDTQPLLPHVWPGAHPLGQGFSVLDWTHTLLGLHVYPAGHYCCQGRKKKKENCENFCQSNPNKKKHKQTLLESNRVDSARHARLRNATVVTASLTLFLQRGSTRIKQFDQHR
jgi:hypothetical protein